MNLVHAIASAFPSPQGTQAAVASMLRAEALRGLSPTLVAHAESAGGAPPEGVRVIRATGTPLRTLGASGPSAARAANDLSFAFALARLRPGRLFAHHVGAALAARASRRPYVFVAHADLEDELPRYPSTRRLPTLAARVGAGVDQLAARGADGLAAISPRLAASIARRSGRPVEYLPIPWPLPTIDGPTRAEARATLGLPERALVVLHAGNLDGYQGIGLLADVVSTLAARAPTVLLLATSAETEGPAVPTCRVPLEGEATRALVHAAADVVVLARTTAFGLPVKLLDALARGVPVVSTDAAAQGLSFGGAVAIASPTAHDLADAATHASGRRAELAPLGRAYLRAHHSDDAYLAARARLVRG